MKKSLLLLSLPLFIFQTTKSQPTITSDNAFAVGDYLVTASSSVVPNEGGSGASQIWDFTGVDALGGSLTLNFVDPSTTAFASSFPFSTVAQDDGSGVYSYYMNTANEADYMGYGYYGEAFPYTDNQEVFAYPCTYNTSFADHLSASGVVNGQYVIRHGSVSFSADAYGKLMLPEGTFANTLRVKYVSNITDTVFYGGSFIIQTNITTYSWYVPGIKSALMSIGYDTSTVNGYYPQYSSFASYTPGANAATLLQAETSNLSIFPNPAVNHSAISFTLEQAGNVQFSLMNDAGQTIKTWTESTLTAGIHSEEIEIGDLESGVYLLRLEMINRKDAIARFTKL